MAAVLAMDRLSVARTVYQDRFKEVSSG